MENLLSLLKKYITREIIIYIIFGVLTTVVSLITYNISLNMGFSVIKSNTISTVIAVLFAFITNKIWVFESTNFRLPALLSEFLKFASGRAFTYFLETILLVLLTDYLSCPPLIAKLITQFVVIILNYVISKFSVFKK